MYGKTFSNHFKRTLYWIVKTNFFIAHEKQILNKIKINNIMEYILV